MRNRIIAGLVLAVLCIALPCPALEYYHLRDDVTNTYGTVASGASVYVYTPNTTTTVTAYTDLAGSTAVTWPLATDSNGYFDCYLARGNYDIRVVYANWSVDTTWDNYMVGAGSDSFQFAAFDSIRIDGDGTTADLRFGRASDTVPSGRLFIPNNHSLWIRRSGGTARRVDGGYDYTFGIGRSSLQFSERTALTWAFGAATDSTYQDRVVLGLDDSSAGDSLGTQIRQQVWFRNTRVDSTDWMWPDGTVKGERAGDWGTPDAAVQFFTDIPDSDSVAGSRIGFQFRWDPAERTNSPLSTESSVVDMQFGNDNIDYSFQRQGIIMQAAPGATDEKIIRWDGGANFTLLTEVDGTGTLFRVNNAELNILADDQGDSARIDINRSIFDYLTLVKWSGKLPVVARAQEFGEGAAFWRGADAEPATAQTLYIYDDGDSLYHYWESDGTVSP